MLPARTRTRSRLPRAPRAAAGLPQFVLAVGALLAGALGSPAQAQSCQPLGSPIAKPNAVNCSGSPVCEPCGGAQREATCTIPLELAGWSYPLQLDSFDSSLGTLQRVNVNVVADVFAQVTVTNQDPDDACSNVTWQVNGAFTMDLLQGGISIFNEPLPASGTIPDIPIGGVGMDTATGNPSFRMCFDDPAVISNFTSAMSGPSLTLQTDSLFAGSSIMQSDCNNPLLNPSLSIGLDVVVTYTYCDNEQPMPAPDAADACAGVRVPIDVLANDVDNDGTIDCTTLAIVDQPTNGTVQVADACAMGNCGQCTVLYTPDPGFVGMDTFTYQVADDDGCVSEVTSVVVTIREGPTVLPDVAATCAGTPVAVDVLANDSDVDGTIDCGSLALVGQPSVGSAVISPLCVDRDPCAGCVITYTPPPGFSGPATFQYTVADTDDCVSGPATVTVNVRARPIAAPDAAFTCEDDPVSIAVLGNDDDPDGTLDCSSVTVLTQPTNGSAMVVGCVGSEPCAGCSVQYTPNPGFQGTDGFTYSVADTDGCVSDRAAVTVQVGARPTALDDAAETCAEQPVGIPILSNDSDSDGTIDCTTLQIVDMPVNGSVVPTAGCAAGNCNLCGLVYTPGPGFTGVDAFTYRVADDAGCVSNLAQVTVTVNADPIAVPDADATCVGQPVQIALLDNDSDPDGTLDCASVQFTFQPANGSVTLLGCTGTGPCTGCVAEYTPNPGFIGDDGFGYTVADTDGCRSNSAIVSIAVQPAPLLVDDAGTTCADTAFDLPILVNDSVGGGGGIDCTTLQLVNVPPTLSVVPQGCGGNCTRCVLVITPLGGFTGVATFDYTLASDTGCPGGPATVTVTVNADPIALGDVGATCVDEPVQIDVLANDSDPDGTIDCASLTILRQPANGAAVVGPGCTGSAPCFGCVVTYTPDPGYSGPDTFTYSIEDEDDCRSARGVVSIDVKARPIAVDDAAATCEDDPVVIDFLANDSDPDGALDCGSVMLLGQPAGGAVTLDPACSGPAPCGGCVMTFTPNATFTGQAMFQYTIDDGDGCRSEPATVVVGVRARPVAVDDSEETCVGIPVDIEILDNDSDDDGPLDCSSVVIETQPTNGTVQLSGCSGTGACAACTATYTPNPGFAGQDSFTYSVADVDDCRSAPATVTINTRPVPVPGVDDAVTCQGDAIVIDVLANDGPSIDPTTVEIVFQPTNGSAVVDQLTGLVTYTPNPGFCLGQDSFTYTVASSAGCLALIPASCTIEVRCDPMAEDDEAEIGPTDLDPIDIDVLENDSDPEGPFPPNAVTIVEDPAFGQILSIDPITGVVRYKPNSSFLDLDTFRYRVTDADGCYDEARVTIGREEECPLRPNRRNPGSLLLFPEFDNREAARTMITITNTYQGEDLGRVDVKIIYIQADTCDEFNRVIPMTPNDTITLLTSTHNFAQDVGYIYAYAVCHETGEPIAFNHLIGQLMTIDGIETFSYAMNALTIRGVGGEPDDEYCTQWPETDLDDDGIRDFDGEEYEPLPDQILIPRFLGQTPDSRSELIFIGLSGGKKFSTTLDFEIFNDNEDLFSFQHTFTCWEKVALLDLTGTFSNDFLQSTENDPGEIFGMDDRESGWIRLNGREAQSTARVIEDPAFYAVLVERTLTGYAAADLPWEYCTQDNGDLLPTGVWGDE